MHRWKFQLSWPCEFNLSMSIHFSFWTQYCEDVHVQQLPSSSSDSLPLLSWVAWSWRKIFVLMASGVLNIAHPNMQFNVLHSKKPWCSNANQRSTFTKSVSGIPIPCYLGFWVEYHNRSLKHHKHWFCPYDLSCCVGGTIWKFAIARPRVPTIWPIQEGTNLT
jgi:hypothetical protein